MKKLKEELKINNDEFDIDDYVIDECCDGRKYRLIYVEWPINNRNFDVC